jgi:voltage-gated potassium channel
MANREPKAHQPLYPPIREKIWHIVFDHNTRASRGFDILLLWLIGLSVVAVMLESMEGPRIKYGKLLLIAEWVFTIFFMVEYFLRLWVSRRPLRYAFSFFGIIDFLAWIPAFISLLIDDHSAQYLGIVRILRMLRVFRILKMMPLIGEAEHIMDALRRSRAKIFVFIVAILTLAILMGTLMYIIEGNENEKQFSSIPTSVYWTIVTITTVGFGDITPVTTLGKLLASAMMLSGYAILAVPTGIVVSEVYNASRNKPHASGRSCKGCGHDGHRDVAKYCWSCGEPLDGKEEEES